MARKPRKTKTETGSVVPADFRVRYKEHSGSCGDELSVRLRKATAAADGSIDIEKLKRLAKANGCWDERYENLNAGLARMNCGNRLRALVRAGKAIKWGRITKPKGIMP